MKHDLTTGTWQDDTGCPIRIILVTTSDAAEGSSLCWSRCAAKAYPCQQEGAFVVSGGSWATVRKCSTMTQLIMCVVRGWRRVFAVVVDGAACIRGEQRKRVGGDNSSSESSLMMDGQSRHLGGALVGDLLPVLRAGCWTLSGFQITAGSSSSMMGRGAVTGGGVGAVGGTLPRRSVRRAWIAASSSGGLPALPEVGRPTVGQPALKVEPPMQEVHVQLLCPIFTLKLWDQQYPVLSQAGFTVAQWDGRAGEVSLVGWPGRARAGAPGAGVWVVIIVASVHCMSWMALESAALVATRLSMVAFFWMDALSRLSSDEAICCACLISAAWLAPKVVSQVVVREISRILANAAVQWSFQFAHVCSFAGRRLHSLQLSVMLPLARACLDPVVTISSSEIGTPASVAKTWHFSCLRV